jgi:3-isopropylmalate dehydrogenase
MEKFTTFCAKAAPLMRVNINTDVVIRINRLIDNRQGQLGRYCFEAWRYRADGEEDPCFILNRPRYRNAQVLLAGENFGCGSSREAAVWSLADFGVRCVIAPSFGDIFYENCFQNGLLPIRLPAATVDALAREIEEADEPCITVDLRGQEITTPAGVRIPFSIDADRRDALLEGLDEIGRTLKLAQAITDFQEQDRRARPWIYRSTEEENLLKVLILPGDGIGPEIMPQVRRVAQWFIDQRQARIELHEELWGIAAWKEHGEVMPEATWKEIVTADAILFGATGSPEYENIPPEKRREDQLLRIRRELDLYNNLRPVKLFAPLVDTSTLKPEVVRGTNMLIVRELAGGIYFGTPRGIERQAGGPGRAYNTTVYTTREIERIARSAFELARTRSGRVCSVDKANVLETGAFWRETVQALRDREFPDIELSHMYADNCAMQLVKAPRQFDVIVTENLFGDLLSDCAAMVAGSLGMLPSASLGMPNADGNFQALYEPIHGSAPDIAGKGVANPLGAIMSFGMCLRYSLKSPQEADRLEHAVERAIAGGARTPDIAAPGMKALSTAEMGDAVLRELDRSLQ